MTIYDKDPQQRLEDGELLSEVIVAKAVSLIEPPSDSLWSDPPNETSRVLALRAALERDGFAIVDRAVRRALPGELGIAAAEDATTQLLKGGPFPLSLGHLEQALDAHSRGDWAAANSQIRSFYSAGEIDAKPPYNDNCRLAGAYGNGRRNGSGPGSALATRAGLYHFGWKSVRPPGLQPAPFRA
jgi:hypothetical protein